MRFLLDEMLPIDAAKILRERFGHTATHVGELGLGAAPDEAIARTARTEQRCVVTENIVDFAAEDDLVLVCVLKRNLPVGGAQAAALAALLDRWATANRRPYVGQHWPR